MNLNHSAVLCVGTFFLASLGSVPIASGQTVVTSFAPSSNTTPGVWYESNITSAGAAGTVRLVGLGGDLDTNQPLPNGAVRLTTTSDDNDRANVGLLDSFGQPGDIFSTLQITYSYHKASNGTQNLSAAPALKLAFFNANCDDPTSAGDCFGTLVFEPTWNGPGATSPNGPSSAPDLDTWKTVTIDANNGLFWWTGGFGQPNTAGGPPVMTLAEWLSTLNTDFVNAELFLIEVGVGSFNQNQLGYFDNVQISHSFGAGYNESYDFEAPPAVQNIDTGEVFSTIQLAIDDVDTVDGDTLQMLVADHCEGPLITFSKSLTLLGASPTKLRAFGDTGTSGDARAWILIELGLTVSFDGIDFDGDGYRVFNAIRTHGTTDVSNCTFNDIQYDPNGPTYAGSGVTIVDSSGPLTVTNCDFTNIGRISIHIFEPATITGCTFTGKGVGDHLDYALCVGSLGTAIGSATISNCVVSGNRGVASSDGSTSAGMLITTFFGAGTNATITDCTITDNSTGVFVGFDSFDTSTVVVNQNLISDNDFGLIATSSTVAVDALENWWGDASGPADALGALEANYPPCFDSSFTPASDVVNADGLGNEVSNGNVDYCPWLRVPCISQATVASRNSGTNPASYSGGEIVIGGTFSATVDLTTTGHLFGTIIGFNSPLTALLGGGQTILVNIGDPGGELMNSGLVAGPIANFSLPVPTDLTLCDFPIFSQAIHILGVAPFALSNAQDFVIGSY